MNRSTLSSVAQKFILHWGEMGTRWGINRTVAQIHALLFLSPRPRPAEEIAATLGIARSNVSNSLHELQNWGIVRVVHVLGDRRDHFESMKDVFEMFRVITHERKKREIDPTLRLRSEEHTSELQSRTDLVCRRLLEKKNMSKHPVSCPWAPPSQPLTLKPSRSCRRRASS